jgi:hypothetical protein
VENMSEDKRMWTVLSERFGNDPGPCTTREIFDYAAECNKEVCVGPDDPPFRLFDAGDEIWDMSQHRGSADFLVARLYQKEA